MSLEDLVQKALEKAQSLADELARIASAPTPQEGAAVRPADLVPLATRYLRLRRRRDQMFPADLFADPAWDMLLEIFVADETGRPISTSGVCHAAAVPMTTGLRWLAALEERALVERRDPSADKRLRMLALTPQARDLVAQWLVQLAALTAPPRAAPVLLAPQDAEAKG